MKNFTRGRVQKVVQLGSKFTSKSHCLHPGHFLETAAGFVGCIRRLEINNKIYNFEPAERQGDVLFGIDIGAQFFRLNHQTLLIIVILH